MIRCDFCGYEFTEKEAERGCRNCPMDAGCRMVKCPRCNYEIPLEPAFLGKLKKIFQRK